MRLAKCCIAVYTGIMGLLKTPAEMDVFKEERRDEFWEQGVILVGRAQQSWEREGGHHFATIIFCNTHCKKVSINGVFKVCFENSHQLSSNTHPALSSTASGACTLNTPRLPNVNGRHAMVPGHGCAPCGSHSSAHTRCSPALMHVASCPPGAAGHGMLPSARQPTKPQ